MAIQKLIFAVYAGVGGIGGGCGEGKGGDLPFQVFSSLRCSTRPAPCKHGAADDGKRLQAAVRCMAAPFSSSFFILNM